MTRARLPFRSHESTRAEYDELAALGCQPPEIAMRLGLAWDDFERLHNTMQRRHERERRVS